MFQNYSIEELIFILKQITISNLFIETFKRALSNNKLKINLNIFTKIYILNIKKI